MVVPPGEHTASISCSSTQKTRWQGPCYQYEWPSYTYTEPHAFHKCMQAIWIMCTVITSECTKLVHLSWHTYTFIIMENIHTRTYLCRICTFESQVRATLTVNAMERSNMPLAIVCHGNHAHYGPPNCALRKLYLYSCVHITRSTIEYIAMSWAAALGSPASTPASAMASSTTNIQCCVTLPRMYVVWSVQTSYTVDVAQCYSHTSLQGEDNCSVCSMHRSEIVVHVPWIP